MAPPPVSKNTIVELVLLALGATPLKDLGLGALRGVLASDHRLAVLDGAVDLSFVWELLEGQPDFDPAAAAPAFCFLKRLEPRLHLEIALPKQVGELSPEEIARKAALCKPASEAVDRAITGAPARRRRDDPSAPARPVPAAAPKPRQEVTARGKILIGASALAALISVGVVAHTLVDSMAGTPRFSPIETSTFAGDIPLRSAEKWGGEVHAALADPAWLREPEDKRRGQLESAAQRLASQQLGALIIEDEAKRQRASAQIFGRPPRVYVRFY
jgi:hypothetical protein